MFKYLNKGTSWQLPCWIEMVRINQFMRWVVQRLPTRKNRNEAARQAQLKCDILRALKLMDEPPKC